MAWVGVGSTNSDACVDWRLLDNLYMCTCSKLKVGRLEHGPEVPRSTSDHKKVNTTENENDDVNNAHLPTLVLDCFRHKVYEDSRP